VLLNQHLFEPVDTDEVEELLADEVDMSGQRKYSVSSSTIRRYTTKHGFKGVPSTTHPHVIEYSNFFRRLITEHKDGWVLQTGRKPVFENGWCDLVVRFVFFVINTIYDVRIAQVASAFDLEGNPDHKRDWCGIMSHICRELGD
jgi:hypothetical protein